MAFNYLQDSALADLTIDQLPEFMKKHGLQRQYISKNPAYTFDVLSDEWQLGTKDFVRLGFMRDQTIPTQIYLSLRIALAIEAESKAVSTVKNFCKFIKSIGFGWQDFLGFQKSFHSLSYDNKRRIKNFFNNISHNQSIDSKPLKIHFNEFIKFLNTQEHSKAKRLKGIFDPEKGIYTDEEEDEINEKLRIKISEYLQALNNSKVPPSKQVHWLGILIGLILLKTIYRRTVQLCMLKWSDVLPVGISFKDHRYSKRNVAPEEEYDFTDVEQLHLRTFKAKGGYDFRAYAEHRSHRLEPELSKLVILYKYYYKKCILENLNKQKINLRKDEVEDILSRCPLFPEIKLFDFVYQSKQNLFATLGYQSDVMHKNTKALHANMKTLSEKLQLSSTRIKQFNISNNRSRHSVITRAVEMGYSPEQVASITGVTVDAIRAYTHLDIKGRIEIDKAVAGQKIFSQYAKLSIEELKNFDGFTVKNEFDEMQGMINEKSNCQTCLSRMCKPFGCYGCNNFRPYLDADHQANLDRIEKKIKFNENADPQTIKILHRSRTYIQAVITLISEIEINDQGLLNAD